jgi:hypothetical protein
VKICIFRNRNFQLKAEIFASSNSSSIRTIIALIIVHAIALSPSTCKWKIQFSQKIVSSEKKSQNSKTSLPYMVKKRLCAEREIHLCEWVIVHVCVSVRKPVKLCVCECVLWVRGKWRKKEEFVAHISKNNFFFYSDEPRTYGIF